MSTTALVRSPSSSNSLARSPPANASLVRSQSSSSNLVPSSSQPKPASPSTPQTTTARPNSNLTPQASTPKPSASPAQLTPGKWQHPRMDEVIRRQSRTNFDNTNMRIILYNIGFILLSFLAPQTINNLLPPTWTPSLHPYSTYTLLLLRLFFLSNAAVALTPLFRNPDPCDDIPLTPSQRQLLGLPAMNRPATPQEKEQWITPPRYSRSTTPQGRSSSNSSSLRGSPVGGIPYSPTTGGGGAGSPYSSSTQQQLGRSTSGTPTSLRGLGVERRRSSYNSPQYITDFDVSARDSISTPTKTNKRASVGLNSKWLYEKGRASPVGLSGAGWGTGSVFS